MTTALAGLTSQGQKVSGATKGLINPLKTYGNSATSATSKTKSLASMFGKLCANFFWVKRGISGIKDAVKSSMDYIETLNYFDAAFGQYIFQIDGKRIKEKIFGSRIIRICNNVGIKPRSLHKARKTYATKLLNAGVDERLVINQMGYTDITTTRNCYYFNNKDEEEARNQIQKALNF